MAVRAAIYRKKSNPLKGKVIDYRCEIFGSLHHRTWQNRSVPHQRRFPERPARLGHCHQTCTSLGPVAVRSQQLGLIN